MASTIAVRGPASTAACDRGAVVVDDPRFRWESAAVTHVGHVRRVNEDAYLDLPQRGLWVVADGMGGHAAGDYASGLIVEALSDVGAHNDPDEFLDDVERRLVEVNRRVYERSVDTDRTIGSTVVAVLAYHSYYVCVWAGDSRVYLINGAGIEQLTRDHSQVEDLVAAGRLAREDVADHPLSNVITRAVGGARKLRLEVRLRGIEDGDRLLLCSDGLYKDLSDTELAGLAADRSPAAACTALLDGALARGGNDNITGVVVAFRANG